MIHQDLYQLWSKNPLVDPDLTDELSVIKDQDGEIYERFYKDLEFGTGGLRGLIGAGINRMNIYTVRRASQGLAAYLLGRWSLPSIAVAYDSRIKSELFAREAAGVFAANGIKCYIYPKLTPTPMLSYAVRELQCQAGIVVTASHNPSGYNGYKVYGPDGCQLTTHDSDAVLAKIVETEIFDGVKTMDFDTGLKNGTIEYIPQSVNESYFDKVLSCSVNPGFVAGSGLKVIYTPLNGTGGVPVRTILERIGVKDLFVVPEQAEPNGLFPTCPSPNPEERAALSLGIELAKEKGADIVVATDPDADRMGVAVRDGDDYRLLSGNEMGVLMLDYIAKNLSEKGKLPKHPVLLKSLVSTAMAGTVARHYGVEEIELLPGFKFIGEEIGALEKAGEAGRFILGFEESYGYLAGSYVRDKDAVGAAMTAVEMAAYYKSKGKTLADAIDDLYGRFGYYVDRVESFGFSGSDGMRKMNEIMDALIASPPKMIGESRVSIFSDYRTGIRYTPDGRKEINLPSSNMVSFLLEGGARVLVRPSGTEPKLKVYYSANGTSMAEAKGVYQKLSGEIGRTIGL